MDGDEYLEQLVSSSYAREIEGEENVHRSLPFGAAALAVIFAFIAAIRNDLPNRFDGIFSIVVWIMLFLFCAMIAAALGYLSRAVAAKPLQYLSPPSDLRKYVADLRTYYTALGTTPNFIEKRVVQDTRIFMIEQYTIGVTHNQKINGERLQARQRAFQSLIAALLLALVTVVLVLEHKLA